MKFLTTQDTDSRTNRENTHYETYVAIRSAFIPDVSDCSILEQALTDATGAQNTMRNFWEQRVNNVRLKFAHRLVAYVAAIMIMGTSCTAVYGYMKTRHSMAVLTGTHRWIEKDCNTHVEFARILQAHLYGPAPRGTAVEIVTEAVECEQQFYRGETHTNAIGQR